MHVCERERERAVASLGSCLTGGCIKLADSIHDIVILLIV